MNREQQIEEMGKKNVVKECEQNKSLYDCSQGAFMTSKIGDLPLTVEGLRKAVDEITRLNSVEAELQELNIKYYNEAKDLRRELAKAEAENERLSEKLKQAISINMKPIRICTVDEYRKKTVKEFAEKLKAKADTIENPIIQFLPKDNKLAEHLKYVKVVNICEIDELLKEYEK